MSDTIPPGSHGLLGSSSANKKTLDDQAADCFTELRSDHLSKAERNGSPLPYAPFPPTAPLLFRGPMLGGVHPPGVVLPFAPTPFAGGAPTPSGFGQAFGQAFQEAMQAGVAAGATARMAGQGFSAASVADQHGAFSLDGTSGDLFSTAGAADHAADMQQLLQYQLEEFREAAFERDEARLFAHFRQEPTSFSATSGDRSDALDVEKSGKRTVLVAGEKSGGRTVVADVEKSGERTVGSSDSSAENTERTSAGPGGPRPTDVLSVSSATGVSDSSTLRLTHGLAGDVVAPPLDHPIPTTIQRGRSEDRCSLYTLRAGEDSEILSRLRRECAALDEEIKKQEEEFQHWNFFCSASRTLKNERLRSSGLLWLVSAGLGSMGSNGAAGTFGVHTAAGTAAASAGAAGAAGGAGAVVAAGGCCLSCVGPVLCLSLAQWNRERKLKKMRTQKEEVSVRCRTETQKHAQDAARLVQGLLEQSEVVACLSEEVKMKWADVKKNLQEHLVLQNSEKVLSFTEASDSLLTEGHEDPLTEAGPCFETLVLRWSDTFSD